MQFLYLILHFFKKGIQVARGVKAEFEKKRERVEFVLFEELIPENFIFIGKSAVSF